MEKQDDLVFDIGMHVGNDTDFYLGKGFRVVGVEANPRLVAQCRARFAAAIAEGRLVIEEGAILDDADERDSVAFYINRRNSEWSTVSRAFNDRNAALGGGDVEEVRVRVLRPAALFARHGVPFYVKIDIEGADTACLDATLALGTKPRFVSIESDKTDYGAVCDELRRLAEAGYRRFAVVQQAVHGGRVLETRRRDGMPLRHVFDRASSGPFGDDLGESSWVGREEAERRYRRVFREYRWFGDRQPRLVRGIGIMLGRLRGSAMPGWYDTHARLD